MTSKNLYIISGCNGAGKTTASYTVLPEVLDCREFVNADEIARGLSPFNPESVAIEAGRLMLSRIEELLERDESFSIETTLATKSYINLVRRAQAQGYKVRVLFFWLRTPDLAVQRVSERVAKGGHNIPTDIIRLLQVDASCFSLSQQHSKHADELVTGDRVPLFHEQRGGFPRRTGG
jgi:predicted ABC-type ATPase